MTEKVLCPYCGAEMAVVMSIYFDSPGWGGRTLCNGCDALGPRVTGFKTKSEAKAAAHAAAQARYLPPNRPLTLDEVEEHCKGGPSATPLWVEFDEGLNRWVRIASEKPGCILDYVAVFISIMPSLYGKEWRCWLRKPTQAEMDAAEWGE